MKIIDLIIFFLANYGFAYIVTQSVLLDEPRDWLSEKLTKLSKNTNVYFSFLLNKIEYLINCIICSSVWTVLFLSFFLSFSKLIILPVNAYDLLLYVLIAPVFTILLNKYLYVEEYEDGTSE